jgi:hypothetical protein
VGVDHTLAGVGWAGAARPYASVVSIEI